MPTSWKHVDQKLFGASGVKYEYMLGKTLYRTKAISNLQVQRSHLRIICIARVEGTRKARNIVTWTAIQDGCYKDNYPKCIYPCESKGMTNDTSVMEVKE